MACRLYLLTPPSIPDLDGFAKTLDAVLDAGDVAAFQLRLKDVPDQEILRAVDALRPIVQARDVAFILNDRPDLAAQSGCDGVHIGQEDGDYQSARALIGKNGIVGVTCHDSRHLAMEAGESGADYVAFGAFFPTATKTVEITAEIATLAWWTDIMEIPCVAIGGITTENARPLIEAGADFLAVAGGVWNHPQGPAEAVKAFDKLFLT